MRIHDDGTQQEFRREMVGSAQGIRGMKERAALFDGTLRAGPASRGGWAVVAKLKLPCPTRRTGTAGPPAAGEPEPEGGPQATERTAPKPQTQGS